MFNARFFAPAYFPRRYFAEHGGAPVAISHTPLRGYAGAPLLSARTEGAALTGTAGSAPLTGRDSTSG